MKKKPRRLDIALIAIATASAVILVVFFLADTMRTEQGFRAAVRMFTAIVSPVPLLLFACFLFAKRSTDEEEVPEPSAARGLLSFAAALGLSLGLARAVDCWIVQMNDLWQVPLCVNSYVYAFNVYNFVSIRNLYLSSVLSAASLGITMHVLFT